MTLERETGLDMPSANRMVEFTIDLLKGLGLGDKQ